MIEWCFFLLLPCLPPSFMLLLRVNKNTLVAKGDLFAFPCHAFPCQSLFPFPQSVSCVQRPLPPHPYLHPHSSHSSLAPISLLPCVARLRRLLSSPLSILCTSTIKHSYLHPILCSLMPYFRFPLLSSSVTPLAPLYPSCILPSFSSPICAALRGQSPRGPTSPIHPLVPSRQHNNF